MVNFWARWNINGFCQGTIVVNVFSMVFVTGEPSLLMVFHISTIGINGFSNGFSIRDDGFFNGFGLANHWYQFVLGVYCVLHSV